jgi:1-acyl-sn-glycerol-3-phosphate acyltransferase
VAFVPVSIEGTARIRLVPPRFPKVRVYYGEPIPLDDLPADDLRRASHAATKRWTAAIEAGLAKLRG